MSILPIDSVLYERGPARVNAGAMTQGGFDSMSAQQRTCSIEGCGRPVAKRRWCSAHYSRWQRHGDPLRERPTLEQRFWSKVDVRGPNDCWEWTASCRPAGYGQIGRDGYGGTTVSSHRLAYELTHGPIPEGLWVLHHCDNPPCVNPAHLFLGTPADNSADMVAKGRARSPRAGAKLSWEQVEEIRQRVSAGEAQGSTAREFGVDQSTVSMIVRGRTWVPSC